MMQRFPNLRLFLALAAFFAAMLLITSRSEKHHQEEVRAWRVEGEKSAQHNAEMMDAIIANQQRTLEMLWTTRINNEYQKKLWEAMKVHMRQEGDELPRGIYDEEPKSRKRRR